MEISTAERFLDFLKFNLITGDKFPLQVDYDYVAKIKTSVDKLNLLLGKQPNSDVQPQLPQAPVSGSLPLTIKGLDVEALANTLYDKWRVNYDDRTYMTRDCFTLAIQDIVRGGNDR